MNNIPQPSTRSLVWSLISSLMLATIIFIIAVLPAEFNIDPTGLGKKLGLIVLSGSTVQNQVEISCPESANLINGTKSEAIKPVDIHADVQQQSDTNTWQDTVEITIPPRKGLEYKFNIRKDEKFEFVWHVEEQIPVYFDFHGEPEGDKTGYFKSFKESTQSSSSGTLSVPFSGSHGWYWENKSNQVVHIKLQTRGHYKIIGLL